MATAGRPASRGVLAGLGDVQASPEAFRLFVTPTRQPADSTGAKPLGRWVEARSGAPHDALPGFIDQLTQTWTMKPPRHSVASDGGDGSHNTTEGDLHA